MPEADTEYESVTGSEALAAKWKGKSPAGDPSLCMNVKVPDATPGVPFTIEPVNFIVTGHGPMYDGLAGVRVAVTSAAARAGANQPHSATAASATDQRIQILITSLPHSSGRARDVQNC